MQPNMTGATVVAVMLAVAIVVAGITRAEAEAAAAPQLLQPLHLQTAQSGPEARAAGYAPGYGYGGVQVPVAVHATAAVGKSSVHLHQQYQQQHHQQQYYADGPPAAVIGYAPSAVYKPDLSAYAYGASPLVEQLRRFDPVVRPVHTVVPKVTAVEPSVTVHKTYVDVPVLHHHADHRLAYVAAGPTAVVQADYASPYYNYQVVDR